MMMAAEDLLLQAPEERILFADDWRKELAGVLPTLPAGTLAVFTGRHWLDAGGVWADFAAVAAATGRKVVRFNDIEAEPCTDTVERMVEFLSSVSASAVIAVGGGSVMDAAKAALLVCESGMPLGELFGVNRYSTAHPEAKPARVLCIPTTSGTGSEATPYSNIVDRKLGVKKLISEHLIVPETAIVSPSLAAAMPKALTLATGCDALAHSIEGFLNTGADGNEPRANAWALESIRLIRGALPAAVADGSCREARAAMARAATLGGMVIRFKSTGLPHLCSFSWFGRLAHGIAVAMLLPASWRYYLGNPAVAKRTMQLAPIFPGRNPEEVITSFRDFLDRLGVPKALRECPGITPELLEATAASAGENRMKLELAPRPVPVAESRGILSAILKQAHEGTLQSW